MQFPHARILIFARAPVAGRVKTRLAQTVGAAAALAVYEEMLAGMLDLATGCGLCPVECWVAPDPSHPFFDAWRQRAAFGAQRGTDLGERMWHALQSGSGPALLVGADCPAIDADYLRQALLGLEDGEDAVIGPAEDGGYVLLGVRQGAEELFRHIPWGTGEVGARTTAAMDALGWRWRALTALADVDDEADLRRWRTEAQARASESERR